MSLYFFHEKIDILCNKHITFGNISTDESKIEDWYELFVSNWSYLVEYYKDMLIDLIDKDRLLKLIETQKINKEILFSLLFHLVSDILGKNQDLYI